MDTDTQTPVEFTAEELLELQVTISSKIFRINQEREQGKMTEEQASRTLRTLSKVAEKCAGAVCVKS